MTLVEAIYNFYDKYKNTTALVNQFLFFSYLSDYCNESLEEKNKLRDFRKLCLSFNLFSLLKIMDMESLIQYLKRHYSSFDKEMTIDQYKLVVFEFVKAIDVDCYNKHLKMKKDEVKKTIKTNIIKEQPVKGVKKEHFIQSNNELISYKGKHKVVLIPPNITKIRSYAFSNNSYIKCVVMRNVEKIEANAFYNLNNLKAVFIGDSIKEIKSNAFMLSQDAHIYFRGGPNNVKLHKDWNYQKNFMWFKKNLKSIYNFPLWDFYSSKAYKFLADFF